MWLWLTLGGLVLAAALGLILGLVVFEGGNGPAPTPEETVRRALDAAQRGDVESLFSLLSPTLKQDIADRFDGPDFESVKSEVSQYLSARFSVEFFDVRLIPQHPNGSTAVVAVVAGRAVVRDTPDGYFSGSYDIHDEGVSHFYLVESEGSWYLDDFDQYSRVIGYPGTRRQVAGRGRHDHRVHIGRQADQ